MLPDLHPVTQHDAAVILGNLFPVPTPPISTIRALVRLRRHLGWSVQVYGDDRLEIVAPDDVIYSTNLGDSTVRWVVVLDRAGVDKVFDCAGQAEALSVARMIPGSRVGYQLVSPVLFAEEKS